jgi:hypothetical protein
MNSYSTNNNYPIINNANEYMLYKKTVSIHSEDRDIIKYPNSSYFELELPQDYLNVSTVSLGNYLFPINYNIFSILNSNIYISFSIISSTSSVNIVNEALSSYENNNYNVIITEGVYTQEQMATELTNQFNNAVNEQIISYIQSNDPSLLPSYTPYSDFTIVYNEVTQSLWFGNTSSEFIITNENPIYNNNDINTIYCSNPTVKTFINWGLPSYLGFFRSNATSITSTTPPQFLYLTNPYWLGNTSSNYYYLEAPKKLNIGYPSFFYMDINLLNNLDELVPFTSTNLKTQLSTTQSNGINNSAFAKIPTDINQQITTQSFNNSYKLFYPVAERIRKIRIKIRFHDGSLVPFDNFNYSFNLIFTMLVPQSLRNSIVIDPTQSQGFNNGFGNIS